MEQQQVSNLEWKFITTLGQQGTIKWQWQMWTRSGQYIGSSERQFNSLNECKADAMTHGYFPPE